ncbi:hypothetical protein SUGI_0738730 [Cryptomeria japonica]|uniref:triacylglycerol lipase SDP1 n=1 Tax=Cryptomeria japonica TaxID=3369 RepID=UPI0024146F3F|nr:triacylglycerol lipase SDP1 [Cryptomeria japonica]GLJ36707.1 hypothetical protein SUGI_0738730 [Cryptomeria japonica]
MDGSAEANVGTFLIGPSTVLGRTIAVRVLLCKSLSEFQKIVAIAISLYLNKCERFLRRAYRTTFAPVFNWLHPRNSHALLALIVGIALILKRYSSVKSKAQVAYRRKFWRNLMCNALTYDEWSHAAKMLEKETPRRNETDLYDEELVKAKLHELQRRRKKGGLQDIVFYLRADLVRNLGNMCNPDLHKGRLQVPKVIKDYIDEVSTQLRMVCDSDSEEILSEEKLAFMQETRHAFGRTALLLSGGASLGAFHVGVVKTLIENHLLPRVVAGASVGSIICAVIATRTWPELQSFFADSVPTLQFFDQLGGIFTVVRRLLTQGALHEIRQLQKMLRSLTRNLTFQEAYDQTGRVLGISVCSPRRHEPPRCLNYLTSPHVVIWSAVTASCAFPGLFQAQELMAKDRHGELIPYHTPFQVSPEESGIGTRQWIDGSLESDLPMMQLKELFNVNHFIVSQANPHIAPLLRFKEFVRAHGGDFAAKLAHLLEMEVKHRCNQILELGFPLGGIAKLFAQEWEGDVTVVMPATLAQLTKLIQNPTHLELQKAVNQGRRCTWEKLSAIKANCDVELVLDECVSFLNRLRKQKRQTERSSPQGTSSMMRFSAAKRIPSWNVMARETSWGSLDEEGVIESGNHQGGPWGGPSWRTLRFARNNPNGSDSESENVDSNVSWTRVGGPLMRTASATTFIKSFDVEGEFNKQWNREEIQNEATSESLQDSALPYSCAACMSNRGVLCNKCGNQRKQNVDWNANNSGNYTDTENQFNSFSETRNLENTLPKPQSRITVAEGDMLLAEKSPTGTVLNVVKREDIALVNRSLNIASPLNAHACECIPLSLEKDFVDDGSSTTSDGSNMDSEADACSPACNKVGKDADLPTFRPQGIFEIDRIGPSNLTGMHSDINNKFTDHSFMVESQDCVDNFEHENGKAGIQSSKDCRKPIVPNELVGFDQNAVDEWNEHNYKPENDNAEGSRQ